MRDRHRERKREGKVISDRTRVRDRQRERHTERKRGGERQRERETEKNGYFVKGNYRRIARDERARHNLRLSSSSFPQHYRHLAPLMTFKGFSPYAITQLARNSSQSSFKSWTRWTTGQCGLKRSFEKQTVKIKTSLGVAVW